MTTPEEHLARILAVARAVPVSSVDLQAGAADALGLVLAEDVISQVSLPSFTNSAMDGYAVRSADVVEAGTRLSVLGDIPAGDTRALTLQERAAWRIMTGAAVPDGADAIIPVEASDGGVTEVVFSEAATPQRHLRLAGEDVRGGDVMLKAGTRLAPHHIAVLASCGAGSVAVYRRPRVAVISTGDELRPAGSALAHGQIHDSNGPMLAALVHAAGARVHSVQHLRDDEGSVSQALEELSGPDGADVIITTGGVSAGAFDVVKSALIEAGDVMFDRVAMQPGKPQGFGQLGTRRVPVFTLPGNPMSTLVSFHVFVLPMLDAVGGAPSRPRVRAVASAGWRSPQGRAQFARVELHSAGDGRLMVKPNTRQGSHHLGELAQASALAVVPAEVEQVRPGDELDVIELLSGRSTWI